MYKDKNDPRNAASKKKYYDSHKDIYAARNARNKDKRRALIREVKDVPCMDCGKRYPYYVMDLDHRDPDIKKFNIGVFVIKGTIAEFWDEVAKCDVVCSNCHRERTHRRGYGE